MARTQYNLYLEYPQDFAAKLSSVHKDLLAKWSNNRSFEYVPMINLWKVTAEEATEDRIIAGVKHVFSDVACVVLTESFIAKKNSGYVFLAFNESTNKTVHSLSAAAKKAMSIPGSTTAMPHGFEPHTTIIKNDPENLDSIADYLGSSLLGRNIDMNGVVLSKLVVGSNPVKFTRIYESAS